MMDFVISDHPLKLPFVVDSTVMEQLLELPRRKAHPSQPCSRATGIQFDHAGRKSSLTRNTFHNFARRADINMAADEEWYLSVNSK